MLFTFGLQHCLMLVGQLDKNVFQAGRKRANFADGNTFVFEAAAQSIERKIVVNESVNRLAKNCGAANAGEFAGGAQSPSDFRRGDFDAHRARRLDFGEFAKRIGRAVGYELAIINVSNMAAAFGFVHVVRCDEKSDALRGKFEQKIPQLSARNGVDARGRLIEKKQLRFVKHGAAEGEALLPSAGELSSKASDVRTEAVHFHNFVDAAL